MDATGIDAAKEHSVRELYKNLAINLSCLDAAPVKSARHMRNIPESSLRLQSDEPQ